MSEWCVLAGKRARARVRCFHGWSLALPTPVSPHAPRPAPPCLNHSPPDRHRSVCARRRRAPTRRLTRRSEWRSRLRHSPRASLVDGQYALCVSPRPLPHHAGCRFRGGQWTVAAAHRLWEIAREAVGSPLSRSAASRVRACATRLSDAADAAPSRAFRRARFGDAPSSRDRAGERQRSARFQRVREGGRSSGDQHRQQDHGHDGGGHGEREPVGSPCSASWSASR